MKTKREERLEMALRDLVSLCETVDQFNDPGHSELYSGLYFAKVSLDPKRYMNDHPVINDACKKMIEEDSQVQPCVS
jgi:hypothetical protein